MNNPTKVIVHCSATPDDSPTSFDIADIDAWHKKRGWKGCGYHYVILRNGVVQTGRDESEVGAHCLGHNGSSIGICYIGTYKPTPEQIDSLKVLYSVLKMKYGFKLDSWHCHKKFARKECPGFSQEKLHKLLKTS